MRQSVETEISGLWCCGGAKWHTASLGASDLVEVVPGDLYPTLALHVLQLAENGLAAAPMVWAGPPPVEGKTALDASGDSGRSGTLVIDDIAFG